jgi:PhoPQ-activated pathogenicity-related protein
MRVNRALKNMLNYLGGNYPRKERDYTEEELIAQEGSNIIVEQETEIIIDDTDATDV